MVGFRTRAESTAARAPEAVPGRARPRRSARRLRFQSSKGAILGGQRFGGGGELKTELRNQTGPDLDRLEVTD